MSHVMRAKLRLHHVDKSGHPHSETLHFHAVAKSDGYPEDGSDENNSFAKWTPSATLQLTVTNPALIGTLDIGTEYYVDFTEAKKPTA